MITIRLALLLTFLCAFAVTEVTSGPRFANSNGRGVGSAPAGLTETVTVQAAGRGTSRLKFKDGREVAVEISGAANLAQSTPLTLATGDFNSDGYEDIVGGYASAEGGVITLYQTNRDSIAPSTEEIHTGMMNGIFPAPFLPEAFSFAVPAAVDFIGVGDFNRDGFKDVLTATRGGSALHLMAGDGRGNFRYERNVELTGPVTAMLVDDVNHYDGMADVIIGLGGAKALIYHNADQMFSAPPAQIDLPADAAAFAVGQMDRDVLRDVVVAAGTEVLVMPGYDQTTGANPTIEFERIALPSAVRSVVTGEFLFDREIRAEIAVLLESGEVNLLARGNIDRRPYSADEQRTILEKRRARDYDGLEAFKKASVRGDGHEAWAIAETPIAGQGGVGASGRLVAAQLSGLSTDDLMVVGAGGNQMRLLQSSRSGADAESSIITLDTTSGVVAAVALRLNIDTAPDLVLLREGSIVPSAVVSPTATINVTASGPDVIANNGVCSLREAIINANHDNQSGSIDCAAGSGADTIMIPAITYTLTLTGMSPQNTPTTFDDDQQLDGYRPEYGDLDIADDDGANSDGGADAIGDLTIVGVAGSTIIQAGTTTTNGGDRVFDVNNFVSPGTAVNATFTNLIIRHGRGVIYPFGMSAPGGGIQFDAFNVPTADRSNKTLTLNNSTVTLNRAAGQGAGVFSLNGSANFIGSTISNNTVTDTTGVNNWNNQAGGGMSYDGSGNTAPLRTFQMSGGTTFSGNAIDPSDAGQQNFGQGGGARIAGGSGATISGNIINNDAQSFGGGFSVDTIPAITISNSTITGNDANTNGGGLFSKPVFVNGSLSTLTLTNNTIHSNRADADNNANSAINGSGGGIFQERGNLSISGGTIGGSGTPNTAFNGGGIGHAYEGPPTASIINNSTITIDTTSITHNTARAAGGGIFHDSFNQTANSTLNLGSTTNVNLTNNSANTNGGGLSVSNNAVANLTRATVRSNKADNDNNSTGDGGGVSNTTNGSVSITGATSLIGGAGAGEGNAARNGGGIASSGSTVTITNGASITHNTVTGTGGGIFSSSGNLVVSGGSISSNTAGGGIAHSGGAASSLSNATINNNNGHGINITGAGSIDVSNNTITGNSGDGIAMLGTGTGSNFSGNTVHSNGGLGIDLNDNGVTPNDLNDVDNGPNALQNFPVINWVRRTDGFGNVSLNAANGSYRIQYYTNTTCDPSTNGEGEVSLAQQIVTVVGNNATFTTPALAYGVREQITAIATHDVNNNGNFDDDGNTSEFSVCKQVNRLPTISATAGNSRQQASPFFASGVATVNDLDQTENTLVMTVNNAASATVNGITVSSLAVDAAGNVTANIVATCTATNASFTLRVADETGEFNEATLSVSVTANTAPTIGTYSNTTVTLNAGGTVTPNAAPTDNGTFTITLSASPNTLNDDLSVSQTTGVVTITAAEPAGTYTVTVTNTDACGVAVTSNFSVKVNAPPVLSNIAKSTNEDTVMPFATANFVAGYTDANSDPLATLRITTLPANGVLKDGATTITAGMLPKDMASADIANLTYTPNTNYNGPDSFGWNASDGLLFASSAALVNITVNPVNDAPTITGQLPVSTAFNTARTLMLSDLQVTDVDNSYPTGFILSASDGTNYTRSTNTITPALNFFGTLAVPVKVNDAAAVGPLDSNTFQLAMTVNPSAAAVKSGGKIEAQAGGGYKISFIGNPGQQYTVQYVDFLPATLAQWQFHSFQTADGNGAFSITVPAPGVPVRFYRAIVP